MASRPGGTSAFLLAICLVPVSTSAQSPPAKSPTQGIPITLPGGLVIVVGGPPAPATNPDVVVLTAAQYREIQERLERLQAQVDAAPLARPRSCELDGRVEMRGRQAVVRLKATFKYVTVRPRTTVFLGCQRAHVVEAATGDGKAPLLVAREDGLRVEVETAGEHTLRLELDVPVAPRGSQGSELGFEIGLPGAPITALTFEAPAQVRRYTLATRTPKGSGAAAEVETEQPEVERFQPGKGGSPLGPVTSLALSWEDPTRKAAVARTADVDVTVAVGPDELLTEARLRLRGPGREWRFTAPATADVAVGLWPGAQPGKDPLTLPTERVPDVIRPEAGQSVWRLEFREPFVADLLVTVTSRLPRGRPSDAGAAKLFSIGPYAVLDLPQQSGIIRVRSPVPWKATIATKGDVRREGEDESAELTFRVRYPTLKAAPADAPISLSLTQLPGSIQARSRHELRLTENTWRLRSEISLAPTRMAVEYIDFDCPTSFQPTVAEPRELIESFTRTGDSTPGRHTYRALLSSPKRSSFSFTMEGDYPHGSEVSTTTVALPRALGVSERSAELIVWAPNRFDIRGSFRQWEGTKSGTWEAPLSAESADGAARLRGSADRAIASVELTWRVAPVAASVRSEADVEIDGDRVRIAQHLTYRFAGRVPPRLHLKSDRELRSVRSSRGNMEPSGDGWDLVVPADGAREHSFTLTYTASVVASAPADLVIPLLIPIEEDTQHVVRVWPPADARVELMANDAWRSAPIEVVEDRLTLPSIVARGRASNRGPVGQVLPRPPTGDSLTVIERARFEVRLTDGFVAYRARYWVREASGGLSFALPIGSRDVELLVQGKRVAVEARSAADAPITLRVPRLVWTGRVTPIEMRYRIAGSYAGRLEPPQIGSAEITGDVSWAIVPPIGAIVLVPGVVAGAWAPGKLLSTLGIAPAILAGDGDFASESEIALRQAEPRSISFFVIPRAGWVLGCSILALGFGLVLVFAPARVRAILCVAGIILALAIAFALPQPLAQTVAAASPGLAFLAVAALIWRLARRRYSRRAARLPAFARPGSSLARPSALRPRDLTLREDVPAASPSALASGA
jgi:hypothetical protein